MLANGRTGVGRDGYVPCKLAGLLSPAAADLTMAGLMRGAYPFQSADRVWPQDSLLKPRYHRVKLDATQITNEPFTNRTLARGHLHASGICKIYRLIRNHFAGIPKPVDHDAISTLRISLPVGFQCPTKI